MAMKPYSRNVPGTRITTITNSFGTSISATNVYSQVQELSMVVSNVGDRVRPLSQSYRKVYREYLKGTYTQTQSTGLYTPPTVTEQSGSIGESWNPSLEEFADSDAAYNAALAELQRALRGELDLSIDLLQLPESRKMVRNWVKGANHLLTTVRTIRKQPLKAAADAYLQWTYGVAPTLQSIYGTMATFADTSTQPRAYAGRGKEIDTKVVNGTTLLGTPKTVRINTSKRCEIGATYTPSDAYCRNISAYTSLNPASLVYEMIPFSFVFDWLYDVGGWLRSLESAYVLSPFLGSIYVTSTVKGDARTTSSGSAVSGGTKWTWGMAASTTFSQKVRNTAVSSTLLPRAPKLASFSNVDSTSVRRTMNGLALSRAPAKQLSEKLHAYMGAKASSRFLS